MDLTDEQWAVVRKVIPKPLRCPDVRGRPWKPTRDVLNGVLWILCNGARWHDLPKRYLSYQTCHRCFQAWVREGTLDRAFATLA